MEQIDWSKAPDWAIGHAIHATAMGVKEVWVGEDKYQQFDHSRPFPYGGTIGADSYHNPRRNQFAFEMLRPAPWNGAGLPPVGTVCEHHKLGGVISDSASWQQVKIIAHVTDDNRISPVAVYMPCGTSAPYVGQAIAEGFRPLRTPEQIAAEQRDKEIIEIARTIMPGLVAAGADDIARAEKLYDAGYRKFEIVPE